MGCDKARMRLGDRTMLQFVRDIAKSTGFRVRMLRRDLVPRSGPLGGIYSALKNTNADAIVFLACDMPFVRKEMIDKLLATAVADPATGIFFSLRGKLTFPILIPRMRTDEIALCLRESELSLQSLGKRLRSTVVRCPRKWLRCLDNINTPDDFARARKSLQRQDRRPSRQISGCPSH
jgi:molybdopterin-guanine dinucleotide biosynthesis protein A